MSHMDPVTIIAILSVFGLPALLGGIIAYFRHRENMAKLVGSRTDSNPQLLARVEALEKKCNLLQEQVNAAHQLIHDEQRLLDIKLAQVLENKQDGIEARPASFTSNLRAH